MMKTKIYCLLLALFVPTFLVAEDIPNNEIWYTSTDGKAVQMHRYQGFGANYVSNSYKKGKGVITFDADITSIGDLAFYRCSTLLTITMPPSIISIGNNAFESCTLINNVVIPNSVSSIGDRAFYKCLNMNTISIPATVTSFGGGVFEECDRLPMIDNVRYADKYLVGAATIKYLSSYSILEGTRWIGSGAFKDCTEFTSITIPNSVISIEGSAFYNCSSLASITLSNSLIDIGYEAFRGCQSLTRIDIPNSVKSIGSYAFYGCLELSGITLSDSLVDIGTEVFTWCNKLPITNNIRYADTYLIRAETKTLSTYSIKEGTKWIGSSAFANCTALTSITIPNTVRSIEEGAFASCSQLYEINIPNHLTNIDNWAFSDCYQLDDIVLPNTLTRIGYNAFSNCGLSAIHIPNSVTSIGGSAFANCTSLTSITIPNSVDTIGWSAFSECISLDSITIPNHVTNIGGNTFYKCKSLTSITIPNAVTSIEEAASYGCTSLSSIICEALTPPTCGANCFYDVNKTIPLYVSVGNIEAYKAANQWKDFTNIQAITAEEVVVTEIGSEPTSTSVEIAWPAVSGSDNYTIEVKQGSKVICTIVFNANGQLMSINFAAPARGDHRAQFATKTSTGWSYTITGFDAGSNYTYTIVAKDKGGNQLYSESGTFQTTGGATALDQLPDSPVNRFSKIIKDGHLYILRSGKKYTMQGAEVK